MSQIILFNKPYNVLSQFTDKKIRPTLADYMKQSGFYPAGRLDGDSESLLLLTNDGQLQQRIAHPKHKFAKIYWVQVDGCIDNIALEQLRKGIMLKDGLTSPCQAGGMKSPKIWKHKLPIRFRADISASWLSITLTEGRNRQIRRMLAQVGYPLLHLIRTSIGQWTIVNSKSGTNLTSGEWQIQHVHLPQSNKRKFSCNK